MLSNIGKLYIQAPTKSKRDKTYARLCFLANKQLKTNVIIRHST
jgi:hypothetical protein